MRGLSWRRKHAEPTPAAVVPAPVPEVPEPTVVADPPPPVEADADIFAAIDRLTEQQRSHPDPAAAAEVLDLRHRAYAELGPQEGRAVWPVQVPDLFAGVEGCPEVNGPDLTSELLASAVTHHGCLLVRGLIDDAGSAKLIATIDEAFRACDTKSIEKVDSWPGSWYRPFRPTSGYPQPAEGHRGWVRSAGGVLAVDSPPAFFEMVEAFEAVGLRKVITEYFGERPILSVDKCTLRRVPLDLGGAEWHQDGSFLGEGIRTLNVWLALTRCGGDEPSPGLDLVPKRFDAILPTGTDGAYFDWSVGHDLAVRESADAPIVRPTFEVGDALLFDELFLHRTALEPTMTTERHAIESWFFAGSCYPGDSIPIVF